MTTIVIDARFYGTEHTGLGRYTTNVLTYLPRHLQGRTLKVLLRKKYYDSLKLPGNCTKVLVEIPHYSLEEQIRLPVIVHRLHPDLYYALHFNVPILLKVPYVVTIHDLIKSNFTGKDTTTRSAGLFLFKRLGYRLSMRHTVLAADQIIVPTNTVKNDILSSYNADPTDIHPILEAPDDTFRETPEKQFKRGSYLLYVGNAYPHKNLAVLFAALTDLPDQELFLVTQKSTFLDKLVEPLSDSVKRRITVISGVANHELVRLYRQAFALVMPSLMEGYGLPGEEALMVGTPVIASNIPVFREVYRDHVTYFDPHSSRSLVHAIQSIKTARRPLSITRNWDDVASDIAEVINESCARL